MENFEKDGIRITKPRTGHCRENIFERKKVTERRKWNKKSQVTGRIRVGERRYGTTDGTLPTEYVKNGKKTEERGEWKVRCKVRWKWGGIWEKWSEAEWNMEREKEESNEGIGKKIFVCEREWEEKPELEKLKVCKLEKRKWEIKYGLRKLEVWEIWKIWTWKVSGVLEVWKFGK